jgi:hypothetical protein
MNHNRAIAASLGKELWTTDWFIPRYRSGETGPWKIIPGGGLIHDRGYYTGPCMVEMLPSLARRKRPDAAADGDQ